MTDVLRGRRSETLVALRCAAQPPIAVFAVAVRTRFQGAIRRLSAGLRRIAGLIGRLWAIATGVDVAPPTSRRTSPVKGHAVDGGVGNECFAARLREMTGPYRARNPLLVGALYTFDAVASLLPRRRKEIAQARPLRVLVANWGYRGDVLAVLPLLKFLERHPRVEELGVLIGSWSCSVLEATDIAARIHVLDHWILDRGNKSTARKIVRYLARRAAVVGELSRGRYDVSIDTFSAFPSSNGITWSAAIPRRVGFRSGGLGRCLTDPFDWIAGDGFILDHQLELLKPLLGTAYPKSLPAAYPGFRSALPKDLLGLGGRPYVVIHMGAPDIKAWVPEKWFALAVALKRKGYELVATGGPGPEMEAAGALREKIPLLDFTGRLSWQQFVATIADAAAVVTVDSVPGHVAACFDVPAVVLTSGRTHPNLWRPNSSNAIALTHATGCAPCHRRKGCAAMACVKMIEVADVLASLQSKETSRSCGQTQAVGCLLDVRENRQ